MAKACSKSDVRRRSRSIAPSRSRPVIHILMDHARMLEALRKAGRVDVAKPN